MATYVAQLRTPMSADRAFAFLADLTNFERWDPGVDRAVQVHGTGPGLDAQFDLTVASVGKPLTLRYRTIEYSSPDKFVVRAETKTLTSLDSITVTPDGTGAIVTYDARLHLNGRLRFLDVVLALFFKRIAKRAGAGLVDALDGQFVDGSPG